MSATDLDVRAALMQRGALLEGHFRLSSGLHSDRFVQKFRILEDPALLEPVARAIADRFRATSATIVVGAAVGGILLGYEVARQLGVKAIFVEKENGAPTLRRGFVLAPSDRALIVEDVLTTGLSVREVMELVRRSGAAIAGVGIIVARGDVSGLRSEGAGAVPVLALLDLPLRSYPASSCPQCGAGEPIADPGSRRS